MNELSREEKVKKISETIQAYWDTQDNWEQLAGRVLDAIHPPEIKPGMWGKFWNRNGSDYMYGELLSIVDEELCKVVYPYECELDYCTYFLPLPGLKEAIEKLEEEQE